MKISTATPITLHLHVTAHIDLHEVLSPTVIEPQLIRMMPTWLDSSSVIELISLCFFLMVTVLMLTTIGLCLIHMPIPA